MSEPDWELYANFSRAEFVCHCGCDGADMSGIFVDLLQNLRERCGFALPVTSGFRCSAHNNDVS